MWLQQWWSLRTGSVVDKPHSVHPSTSEEVQETVTAKEWHSPNKPVTLGCGGYIKSNNNVAHLQVH
jgi:hypothetical protein